MASNSELLEERAEIREKLKGVRSECDQLQQQYDELMARVRGLELTLGCAVKGLKKMEARVEEINRSIDDEAE